MSPAQRLGLGLGLLLLQAAAAEFSWQPCDGYQGSVSVAQVVLEPNPPIIGSPATFKVQGTSSVPVQAGDVDIDVSFGGIQIFSQTEDLCAKTSCPVQPGNVLVTLVEMLPPIAPPGEYGLRVHARDAAGVELLCLDVVFELVMPGLHHVETGGKVLVPLGRKSLPQTGSAQA